MSFFVINSVHGTDDELSVIAGQAQGSGLESLRGQPGFKSARLLKAEDKSELLLIIEWRDREAFVAYRQSDVGKQNVEQAAGFHPKIGFYSAIAIYEP